MHVDVIITLVPFNADSYKISPVSEIKKKKKKFKKSCYRFVFLIPNAEEFVGSAPNSL